MNSIDEVAVFWKSKYIIIYYIALKFLEIIWRYYYWINEILMKVKLSEIQEKRI